MAVLTRCADYFKHFDRDRSGSLDAEEFRCVFRVRRRVRVCVSRACVLEADARAIDRAGTRTRI